MSTTLTSGDDGSFVKTARDKLGLTQEELGEVIGRDRRSVGRYERAEEELPPGMRLAILHLLDTAKQKKQKLKLKKQKLSNGSKHNEGTNAKAIHARRRD